MKRYWAILIVLALTISACEDEQGATPGSASTYVKLFGGSNSDIAYVALPTSDGGAICLGTTEIETPTQSAFKIRLIKIDGNGNTEWQQLYPQEDQTYSLVGRAVLPLEDGYIVVGDSINDQDNSSLILFKVDLSGNEINGMRNTDSLTNAQLHGLDIIQDINGDLVVLGKIDDAGATNDIYLSSVSSTDLSISPDCRKLYSGGSLQAIRSLYQTNSGDIIFSGTVHAFTNENARILRVPDCTAALVSGPLLVQGSSKNYTAHQVVPYGNGFAMVGTTNDSDNGSKDVFLAKLGPFGTVQSIKVFGSVSGVQMTNDEEGYAITATDDGGFLLAGSTLTKTKGETDILIIKTDGFGNEQWSGRFGDLNEDYATSVAQSSDGGYLIFGNTAFGGINTMILIKTDSEGNIE